MRPGSRSIDYLTFLISGDYDFTKESQFAWSEAFDDKWAANHPIMPPAVSKAPASVLDSIIVEAPFEKRSVNLWRPIQRSEYFVSGKSWISFCVDFHF